jgi:hypothetical protein
VGDVKKNRFGAKVEKPANYDPNLANGRIIHEGQFRRLNVSAGSTRINHSTVFDHYTDQVTLKRSPQPENLYQEMTQRQMA